MRIILATLLLIAVLVAAAVFAVLSRRYRTLLSNEHFLEVAKRIPGVKKAALERLGRPIEPAENALDLEARDPRVVFTQRELVLLYTIETLGERFLHRISLSHRGGPMAFAAGGRFAFLCLRMLGVDPVAAAAAHSASGVTHLGFVMEAAEQDAFSKRTALMPRFEDIQEWKDRGGDWLRSIQGSGRLFRSEVDLEAALRSGGSAASAS